MVYWFRRAMIVVLISFVSFFHATSGEAEEVLRRDFAGEIYDLVFEYGAYALLEGIHGSFFYEVYPISGYQIFSEKVLRAREIVFQPNSNLVFDALNHDYIAIVANKIKFTRPQDGSYMISSLDVRLPDGKDGNTGTNGPGRPHAGKGHDGQKGGAGGTGGAGEHGKSTDLPDLYVFANEVVLEGESDIPVDISFIFNGIDGSDGGNGGAGGNGGKGGDGGEASIRWLKCRHEPRDGGQGGDAGIGGPPGNGGNGGNGADIIIVGSPSVVDRLSFSRFKIDPGVPGIGGTRGREGQPGSGGQHGHRDFVCQRNSDDGRTGAIPKNSHPPRGAQGEDGNRGRVYVVKIGDVSPLLKQW